MMRRRRTWCSAPDRQRVSTIPRTLNFETLRATRCADGVEFRRTGEFEMCRAEPKRRRPHPSCHSVIVLPPAIGNHTLARPSRESIRQRTTLRAGAPPCICCAKRNAQKTRLVSDHEGLLPRLSRLTPNGSRTTFHFQPLTDCFCLIVH